MPEDSALIFGTVRSLGAALRRGQVSSVALTELFLDRCDRLGPRWNALVTLTRDSALVEAAQADAELAAGEDRGPLHGIPYGAKDLLATRGIRTTWGAEPFRDRIIEDDATVITRLRRAGAVLVAKLSMVEIAGGLGYRQANASFTGPGRNPWNAARWSGGSSSGSGAAVAAGLVPFAIGSETWGSIITPAAFCGVAGLRPTFGRVSRHGAMALSWTLDKLGPMGRTVDDCGLVLEAIAGPDPHDEACLTQPYQYVASAPPSLGREPDGTPPESPARDDAGRVAPGGSPAPRERFRLATLRGAAERVHPAVRASYERSLSVLAEYADLEEIELPEFPYDDVAVVVLTAEVSAAQEELIWSGDISRMTAPEDRYRLYARLAVPAVDYIRAQRIRTLMQRELDAAFAPFDAVVTPSLDTVAGPVDVSLAEWSRGFEGSSIGAAANLAGLPGISVPNGFDEDGLPTGLSFTARALEENRVLQVAAEYQRRTDWHEQHPSVE